MDGCYWEKALYLFTNQSKDDAGEHHYAGSEVRQKNDRHNKDAQSRQTKIPVQFLLDDLATKYYAS